MATRLTKITSRFEASPIDDEIMLIDVDTGRFFALKDVALRIWNLIDTQGDLDAIADSLCQEFEVDPDHARSSVRTFAESLINAGFARFS